MKTNEATKLKGSTMTGIITLGASVSVIDDDFKIVELLGFLVSHKNSVAKYIADRSLDESNHFV